MADEQTSKPYLGQTGLEILVNLIKSQFAPKTHTHTVTEVTDLTIDSSLSAESENPVQNKVIQAKFAELEDSMSSGGGGGTFNFDEYADAQGYSYSYNSESKEETIYDASGSVFATQVSVQDDTTGSWTITTSCPSLGVNIVKVWTKNGDNWSGADQTTA